MVTKAELEKQVAELKEQLARQPDPDAKPSEPGPEPVADTASAQDWETVVQDVIAELKDIPNEKPILLALGAFALGYLVGRSR